MKKLALTILILFVTFFGISQTKNVNKLKSYNWMVGLLWNNVFDSGLGSQQFLDVEKSWNLPVYPSALNLDIPLKRGFSMDFLTSYNFYKLGKTIDKHTDVSGHFFSLSTHLKYSLGSLVEQEWFDVFIFSGIGYTGRETNTPQSTLGGIIGLGFNIFVVEGIGVQFRGTGNFNLLESASNYTHVHFGLVYRYSTHTRYSKFSRRKYYWSTKKPRY